MPRLRALPTEGELIPPLSEGHGDGALYSRIYSTYFFILILITFHISKTRKHSHKK